MFSLLVRNYELLYYPYIYTLYFLFLVCFSLFSLNLHKGLVMTKNIHNSYIKLKQLLSLCQGSVVCHVFPPLVSIYGLLPVLVSCHLWVKYVPAVFVSLCVNYPVYISPVFWVWFRLVYLWLPSVSCLSALSCPALMLLNTIIWVYVLVCVSLFLPRVCTVTEDQTQPEAAPLHLVLFCSFFEKFLFCSCLSVPWQGSRRS